MPRRLHLKKQPIQTSPAFQVQRGNRSASAPRSHWISCASWSEASRTATICQCLSATASPQPSVSPKYRSRSGFRTDAPNGRRNKEVMERSRTIAHIRSLRKIRLCMRCLDIMQILCIITHHKHRTWTHLTITTPSWCSDLSQHDEPLEEFPLKNVYFKEWMNTSNIFNVIFNFFIIMSYFLVTIFMSLTFLFYATF